MKIKYINEVPGIQQAAPIPLFTKNDKPFFNFILYPPDEYVRQSGFAYSSNRSIKPGVRFRA